MELRAASRKIRGALSDTDVFAASVAVPTETLINTAAVLLTQYERLLPFTEEETSMGEALNEAAHLLVKVAAGVPASAPLVGDLYTYPPLVEMYAQLREAMGDVAGYEEAHSAERIRRTGNLLAFWGVPDEDFEEES